MGGTGDRPLHLAVAVGHLRRQRGRAAWELLALRTDVDRGLILVEGSVPGAKGGWILVRDAVKRVLPQGVPVPGAFRKREAAAAPAATVETAESGESA